MMEDVNALSVYITLFLSEIMVSEYFAPLIKIMGVGVRPFLSFFSFYKAKNA
jgi:hypothetical protein